MADTESNADSLFESLWNKFEESDSTSNFLMNLNISTRARRGMIAFEIVVFIIFLSVLTSGWHRLV